MRRYLTALLAATAACVLLPQVTPPVQAAAKLPQTRIVAGTNGVLGVVDKTSRIGTWAKYYGAGLGYKDVYVRQGSGFILRWRVTTASGAPVRRQRVTLLANKAYGGSTATFAAGSTRVGNDRPTVDGTRLAGITDARGYVRFSLRDTSPYAEPASTPTDGIDKALLETGAVYGQFALLLGNYTQTRLALDLVDVHVIAAMDADPLQYAANLNVGALVWSEEFLGTAGAPVDSATWTARFCGRSAANGGGTCFNNESQYYLPSAVALDGSGNAVITTTHITTPPGEGTCLGTSCAFTSGRFDTFGKVHFRYGYIEARIKLPVGDGNWPSFWMLGADLVAVGWPYYGEIDIAETSGDAPTLITGSLHYAANNTPGSSDTAKQYHVAGLGRGVDYTADFHRYAMAWLPNQIAFYVDGRRFFTITNHAEQDIYWPFNEPFFMIINNAVTYEQGGGGKYNGWAGSSMSVDWVRQYRLDGQGDALRVAP